MDIVVTREALDAMEAASRAEHPREACGILSGEGTRVSSFMQTANIHPHPETHFEIDPQALIDAHREARNGGPQVIGYFHSHPQGEAAPSKTDRAMAAGDGKVWAIAGKGRLQFWRDDPAGFRALSYSVEED